MSKISEDFIKEQKEEITAKLKDQQTIKVSAEDFKNYLAQHSVGKKNLNSYLSEVKNKPTIAIITQEALSDIKKDLSNIDLSGSTIIDVQFDDYNLTATNFSNCFLQQLDNGVVFKNCDLTDANFTNANEDIIGKDLQPKVTFYNCKMAGADLRGMNYATGAFEIKDETLNALVQQLLGDNKLLKKDNKTTIEKNYRNLKLSIPNIDALVENSNRYEEIRSKDLQKQDQLKSTLVELEDKIKDTEDKIEKLKSDDTFDMIKANVTEVADKVMDSAKDYFTNLFSNTTQPEAQQQETRLEKLNNIKEDLTTLKTNITKEIDANQTNIDNGLKTIRDTSFDEFISAFKTLNIKENIICDPIFIANDNNAKEVKEKKNS